MGPPVQGQLVGGKHWWAQGDASSSAWGWHVQGWEFGGQGVTAGAVKPHVSQRPVALGVPSLHSVAEEEAEMHRQVDRVF